jgi:hypothetical protein
VLGTSGFYYPKTYYADSSHPKKIGIIMNHLPKTGFLSLTQIIGNPKAEPPIPAVIPASKSTWWEGAFVLDTTEIQAQRMSP